MAQIIINGKTFTLQHVDPVYGDPFIRHQWGKPAFEPDMWRYEWQRPLATKEVQVNPVPDGNPRDN